MDIVRGSIVKSKAGHNKDSFFVVFRVEGAYAFICDGKHRKIDNPKKKNLKHLALTKSVVELPQTNKQLRKLLSNFSNVD